MVFKIGNKINIGRVLSEETKKKIVDYKLWREAVFKRDDWTCIDCKERGGKLNADHIKPFSLYPELRCTVSNGRTLCEGCHKKTPTWGGRIQKYVKII